jgi:hypothetical protein
MGDLIGPIVENLVAGLLGSALVFAGASSSAGIASGSALVAATSRTMSSIRS